MNNSSPERYEDRSPLRQLNNDLRLNGRSYYDIRSYVQDFIGAQFFLQDSYAELVMADIDATELLPTATEYDDDEIGSIERFRLALWQYALPLAEVAMDKGQLDDWVPEMATVAFDTSGRHTPNRCRLAIGSEQFNCAVGCCPVGVIATDVQGKMQYPDFTNMDYSFMHQKTKDDTLRRLYAATKIDVFPAEYSYQLELSYRAMYDEAFQSQS